MYNGIVEPEYVRKEREVGVERPCDVVTRYYDKNNVLRKKTWSFFDYEGITDLEIYNSQGYLIYTAECRAAAYVDNTCYVYKLFYSGDEWEDTISGRKEELSF